MEKNRKNVCVCVCMCVCAHACSVMSDSAAPWTGPHQTLLSMGFPRQEYWSGLPFPSPGKLLDPRIEPTSLVSPALAGGFFTTEPPGKPYVHIYTHICNLYSRLPCPRNRQFCLSCSLQQCQIYRICWINACWMRGSFSPWAVKRRWCFQVCLPIPPPSTS